MNQSNEAYISGNLRAMDANLNRATEGLRVVEDFCRFVLNDHFFSEFSKRLRHQLTSIFSSEISQKFLRLRDSANDVGATIRTESEYQRTDANALIQANLKRAQQAVRSLEEFSKTFDGELTVRIESLRYEAYSLESALAATLSGQGRISDASVYVLIDGCIGMREFSTQVKQIVDSSADILQLRSKMCSDRDLLAQCHVIQNAIRNSDRGILFIVNDRPEIARIANADGVHLGQDDLSVADARRILGPDCLIGVSTHSIEQARNAVTDGANYIGVGPVFHSSTKNFDQFPGLDFVAQVADEFSLPAFAIGGIDAENVDEIIQHGIRRVAVSNAIWRSNDPATAVEEIKNRFEAM